MMYDEGRLTEEQKQLAEQWYFFAKGKAAEIARRAPSKRQLILDTSVTALLYAARTWNADFGVPFPYHLSRHVRWAIYKVARDRKHVFRVRDLLTKEKNHREIPVSNLFFHENLDRERFIETLELPDESQSKLEGKESFDMLVSFSGYPELFRLHFEDGLTVNEIAVQYGRRKQGISQKLQRGYEAIRRRIENRPEFHDGPLGSSTPASRPS